MIEVYEIRAEAGDVLHVIGAVDGVLTEGWGWQSAMTYHYPPDAYIDGVRKAGVKSHVMTDAEKLAYCESLLKPEKAYTPVVIPGLKARPIVDIATPAE